MFREINHHKIASKFFPVPANNRLSDFDITTQKRKVFLLSFCIFNISLKKRERVKCSKFYFIRFHTFIPSNNQRKEFKEDIEVDSLTFSTPLSSDIFNTNTKSKVTVIRYCFEVLNMTDKELKKEFDELSIYIILYRVFPF